MSVRRLLFYNFYVVYRLDRWTKDRFTPLGLLVLGGLFVAAMFGVNTRASLSYQLAGLWFALLVVALGSAVAFRARFSARRVLPRYATVGEPLRYPVWITCTSAQPQRGLILAEALRVDAPTEREFRQGWRAEEARRNWFDRNVGYPRWASVMRLRQGARREERALPDLAPGRPARIDLRLTPTRRGHVRLPRLDVLRPDPFGLFRARSRIACADSLLVLPRRYPVSWRDLVGVTRERSGGASASETGGGYEEFMSLREYRPGDPIRHIYWRGFARHGEPIVKEFHDVCYARQALVLDTALPDDGTRVQFEEAVSVAASFACAAPTGRSVIDLLFAAPEPQRVSSGPGIATRERILEVLACVEPGAAEGLEILREAVVSCAGELTGAVCVLLDWDEPRQSLVTALRRMGLDLLVLIVAPSGDSGDPHPGPMADCPGRFRVLEPGQIAEGLAAL
jgi:uncharacterized protein (DUF58 family)